MLSAGADIAIESDRRRPSPRVKTTAVPHPWILTLDVRGLPHRWINWQAACHYYALDMVAWAVGSSQFRFFGGIKQ